MDTEVGFIDKLDITAFRAKLNDAETGLGTNIPLLVFDNHDSPRLDARYGDGVHDTDIQRVVSTILFASRGTALFYYGDEIGMKTTPPTRKEDVKDPIGISGWPKEKGRDGERTPMQWDSSVNAGFTTATAKPWLPVPPSASTINAQAEKINPNSLLAWYRSLIHLKKTNPALARGENVMLDTSNTKVLSWLRQASGAPAVVVSVNFTADPHTVSLTVPGASGKTKTLLKTPGAADPVSLNQIVLGPYGVYIGEVRVRLSCSLDRGLFLRQYRSLPQFRPQSARQNCSGPKARSYEADLEQFPRCASCVRPAYLGTTGRMRALGCDASCTMVLVAFTKAESVLASLPVFRLRSKRGKLLLLTSSRIRWPFQKDVAGGPEIDLVLVDFCRDDGFGRAGGRFAEAGAQNAFGEVLR